MVRFVLGAVPTGRLPIFPALIGGICPRIRLRIALCLELETLSGIRVACRTGLARVVWQETAQDQAQHHGTMTTQTPGELRQTYVRPGGGLPSGNLVLPRLKALTCGTGNTAMAGFPCKSAKVRWLTVLVPSWNADGNVALPPVQGCAPDHTVRQGIVPLADANRPRARRSVVGFSCACPFFESRSRLRAGLYTLEVAGSV